MAIKQEESSRVRRVTSARASKVVPTRQAPSNGATAKMKPSVDVSPAEVRLPTGTITRARVFHHGGKLYVVRNANDVRVYDSPKPVAAKIDGHNGYKSGDIQFFQSGCRCGYTLYRVSLNTLISKAVEA